MIHVTSPSAGGAKAARSALLPIAQGLLYTGGFPRSAGPEPGAVSGSCPGAVWAGGRHSRAGGARLRNGVHVSLCLIKHNGNMSY